MDKNFSKLITADLEMINSQLNSVAINENLKKFIDKNVNFLKRKLKNLVQIKSQGSYATGELYNFEKELNIDLLAIKHVNKSMYKIYEQEFETNDHFDDCWICEINQDIYKIVSQIYKVDQDIKIEWIEKKYMLPNSKEKIVFKDSIKISFFKENKLGFSIIIRSALQHSEYPPILCNKTMYKRTFSLEYVKAFRVLNKLSIRKLQILFYYIRIKFRKLLSKNERLILKISIMSNIQYELTKNINFQIWLDKSFDYHFSSKKAVDNVLDSKFIYYKRPKKISNLYNSFKLKNLNWVFNKTYQSTKEFLDNYLNYSQEFINNKQEYIEGNFYFWYDSVSYLKNTAGSTSISIKKENKKYDEIDIQIHSRTIYPTNKENGLFLVFLQYYNFEIERN
ncbi:hypothetical protein [Spiroplasma diminutum]|uniref:Uncharacterized protein n=1 Tax=Spiroplasma diminutum CUAS-1 TaxID=1276221 RepID=S5M1U1_9MOLU|nr:hypothetical protein [Spiroplasma diminutum]AGR42037.1 hypothetical protein SDIMI_v3c03330 [Spiroplasma diminutum CUAS-1]